MTVFLLQFTLIEIGKRITPLPPSQIRTYSFIPFGSRHLRDKLWASVPVSGSSD